MSSAVSLAPERHLVGTALKRGGYGIFLDLLEKSGVGETLEESGPFTLFAPNDGAFERIPAATMSKLKRADQTAVLKSVMGFHFAAGRVLTARLLGKRIRATTFGGKTLHINGVGGLKVNGAAVVDPDVLASNGVLHGIDRLLWPREPDIVA